MSLILKAIRRKCIDCCCGSRLEVRLCPSSHCDLYPYRMGTNPFRKARAYSPEQRVEVAKRLPANRPAEQAEIEPEFAWGEGK